MRAHQQIRPRAACMQKQEQPKMLMNNKRWQAKMETVKTINAPTNEETEVISGQQQIRPGATCMAKEDQQQMLKSQEKSWRHKTQVQKWR